MRKSKRPRRTDAPKKYGEVKIIQQPASLIAGTDICIATGKQPVVILQHSTFSWTRCFSQHKDLDSHSYVLLCCSTTGSR